MKKLFAIAFVGIVALSCSKKNDNSLQDSNTMLQEPEVTVVDSGASTTVPTVETAKPIEAVKTDSATAK